MPMSYMSNHKIISSRDAPYIIVNWPRNKCEVHHNFIRTLRRWLWNFTIYNIILFWRHWWPIRHYKLIHFHWNLIFTVRETMGDIGTRNPQQTKTGKTSEMLEIKSNTLWKTKKNLNFAERYPWRTIERYGNS